MGNSKGLEPIPLWRSADKMRFEMGDLNGFKFPMVHIILASEYTFYGTYRFLCLFMSWCFPILDRFRETNVEKKYSYSLSTPFNVSTLGFRHILDILLLNFIHQAFCYQLYFHSNSWHKLLAPSQHSTLSWNQRMFPRGASCMAPSA